MPAAARCRVRKEPVFINILLGLLGGLPDGSVIDSGAHVGTETCLFAQAAPGRIVHAIEPLYTNVNAISTKYRHLTNLRPIQAGLGSEEMMVEPISGMKAAGQMYDPAKLRKKRLRNSSAHSDINRRRWFDVRRVDSLFQDEWRGETLALAHFDVEGAELDVLRGATATILRDAPVVTTELFVHANASYTRELMNYVSETLQYDSYLVEEVCGLRMDCRNLLHVPRRRAGILNANPILGLAAASWKLFRVNEHTVSEHAFPCCSAGRACCSNALSKTCCNEAVVQQWLNQRNRSFLSGSREQPMTPCMYREGCSGRPIVDPFAPAV